MIDAKAGIGNGGESLGCSYWGGGGGGGSGGLVALQSATSILVSVGAIIDVRGGAGDNAEADNDYYQCDKSGTIRSIGDGGDAGHGLIQLQVPKGSTATVIKPGTTDTNGSIRPPSSWVDTTNTLAPVEFTPISVAVSTWYDFGRVIDRSPSNTNPVFSFRGLKPDGLVETDPMNPGYLLSPDTSDIVCGYLGQIDPNNGITYKVGEEPKHQFIPTNATIRVEFQGARAIVEGSKEIDPLSVTAWSASPAVASSRQFIRWRITFDTTADNSQLTPDTRLPIVERLEIHADF